ncbi:ParB N-terminal domain-containing protein [Mycobacterium tuberculosis]|nr:ParB N-terminal domain-containing protein [Mycobacterium tuberculosis]
MLQPIGVTPDRRLVFGQRRLEAARLLGWERIPVHVCHTIADVVDRAKAERSENTLRKDFTPDRRLVFGQRRLEAARLLGWERIPVHVCHTIADVVDRAKAERSENTLRKDFTPSELLAAGRRIAELERPKAKQRQREGGDHGRQARYSGLGSMEPKPESERDAHKADTAISEALGISRGHYQRLKRIDNATRSEAGYRDGLNGWSG